MTLNMDELGRAHSEIIVQLTNQLIQNELEKNDIIHDKSRQLLIVSNPKDSTKPLQRQEKSALSPESDTVARLNAIEENEKLIEKENNLFNSIARSTHNLSKAMTDMLVLRQESTTATAQIEIELKHKTDELDSVKSEKTHLERKVVTITEQLHRAIDEREKALDKLNKLKQANSGLIHKLVDTKRTINMKKDVIRSIQYELSTKDAQLTDSKNKENKLRIIAKKYKNLYLKLKMKEDKHKTDLAVKALEEQAAAYTVGESAPLDAAEMEKVHAEKIDDCEEKSDKFRKDNKILKKPTIITVLQEANRQIIQNDQSSKNPLEANVKESGNQNSTKQETIARLTQKEEAHNISVSQLHQRFKQHISKSSSNSETIHENRGCETLLKNNGAAVLLSTSQTNDISGRRWLKSGHKRPLYIESLSTVVEKLFSSETTSKNKRTRLSEQRFQLVTNIDHIAYKVPTSSKHNEGGNVVTGENKDDDESSYENKEADEKELIAGASDHTRSKMFRNIVSQAKDGDEPNTFEDSVALTAQIDGDKNVSIETGDDDCIDVVETDQVDRIKAEESHEAETSSQMKRISKYMCGGPLMMEIHRTTPNVWHKEVCDEQSSSHPTPHRFVQKIGEIVRRSRRRL